MISFVQVWRTLKCCTKWRTATACRRRRARRRLSTTSCRSAGSATRTNGRRSRHCSGSSRSSLRSPEVNTMRRPSFGNEWSDVTAGSWINAMPQLCKHAHRHQPHFSHVTSDLMSSGFIIALKAELEVIKKTIVSSTLVLWSVCRLKAATSFFTTRGLICLAFVTLNWAVTS